MYQNREEIDELVIKDCIRFANHYYKKKLEESRLIGQKILIIGPGSSPAYYCLAMKNLPIYNPDIVEVIVLPITLSHKYQCERAPEECETDMYGKPWKNVVPGGKVFITPNDILRNWNTITCQQCAKLNDINYNDDIVSSFANAAPSYFYYLFANNFQEKMGPDIYVYIIDYVDTGNSMNFLFDAISKFAHKKIIKVALISYNNEYYGRGRILSKITPNEDDNDLLMTENVPSVLHIKYEFPRLIERFHINHFDEQNVLYNSFISILPKEALDVIEQAKGNKQGGRHKLINRQHFAKKKKTSRKTKHLRKKSKYSRKKTTK